MIRTAGSIRCRAGWNAWTPRRNHHDRRRPLLLPHRGLVVSTNNKNSVCCDGDNRLRHFSLSSTDRVAATNQKVTNLPPSSASSSSSSSSSAAAAAAVVVDNTDSTSITSFAIGSLAGLLGSLAGMGGGFVMIPLLTSPYLFRVPLTQHQAHGTSLLAVAATGLAGAVSYYYYSTAHHPHIHNDNNKNNNINTSDTDRTISPPGGGTTVVRIPEAAAIAGTAIVTARWGAQATLAISGTSLKRALGYLMLFMAPAVPAKAYYLDSIADGPTCSSDEATFTWNQLIYPTVIGIGSGFLSGLFGVGGGTIVVPALTLLTDLTHHEALGTSLAAMILPALSGSWTHYQAGNCVLRVAPFLATGALVGAYVGAKLSLQTNESILRFGFAALLGTLGVRTLIKA